MKINKRKGSARANLRKLLMLIRTNYKCKKRKKSYKKELYIPISDIVLKSKAYIVMSKIALATIAGLNSSLALDIIENHKNEGD